MIEAGIHPTAVVAATAEIADDATIGPYCVIHENTVISSGTVLKNSVTILPNVRIGSRTQIWPNAVLGGPPQDVKYKGADTRVEIGDDNVVREGVTIHIGSEKGGGVTRIGNGNYFMCYSHVAHDCQIGDGTLLSQNALLGGHVHVEDNAIICGGTAMHQFVRVGRGCYVGGLTRIVHDIPPYMIVEGNPAQVRGVNVVGLRRRGVPEERVAALVAAYRILWGAGQTRSRGIALVRETVDMTDEVAYLLEFLERIDEGKHGRYLEASR